MALARSRRMRWSTRRTLSGSKPEPYGTATPTSAAPADSHAVAVSGIPVGPARGKARGRPTARLPCRHQRSSVCHIIPALTTLGPQVLAPRPDGDVGRAGALRRHRRTAQHRRGRREGRGGVPIRRRPLVCSRAQGTCVRWAWRREAERNGSGLRVQRVCRMVLMLKMDLKDRLWLLYRPPPPSLLCSLLCSLPSLSPSCTPCPPSVRSTRRALVSAVRIAATQHRCDWRMRSGLSRCCSSTPRPCRCTCAASFVRITRTQRYASHPGTAHSRSPSPSPIPAPAPGCSTTAEENSASIGYTNAWHIYLYI